MNKATLRRVATASLSGMTEAEILADPAAAFHIALATMRAAHFASTPATLPDGGGCGQKGELRG